MGFSKEMVRTSSYYWDCTFLLFWKTNEHTERSVITTDVQERDREKSKPKISDTKLQKKIIVIDMKGAVVKEGVYEMKEGDRVKDAIEKAGGFTRGR